LSIGQSPKATFSGPITNRPQVNNLPYMNRLGILISGRGSNFQAIADCIAAGELDACIAIVISNQPGAAGLTLAWERHIPRLCIPSKDVPREEYDSLLAQELNAHEVDLVCLAGYMRLLSPGFIRAFENRILNIHPSLLPSFPGLEAQAQALRHGVKVTGCTVHFVTDEMDAGPIVMQAAVPVLDDDTESSLSKRILEQEHRIYSKAIGLVLSGRHRLRH
jgi:phosphoribosylglycinamide formyltransferase-1